MLDCYRRPINLTTTQLPAPAFLTLAFDLLLKGGLEDLND